MYVLQKQIQSLKELIFILQKMSQAYNFTNKYLSFYLKNGYVVIPKVISSYLCQMAVDESQKLKNVSGFLSRSKLSRKHGRTNFFVDEYNQVSHFFEQAYTDNKELDKQSMIKIGHALHTNKIFEEITYCAAVKQIQSELGFEKSIVVQSMMLQKLPRKGGKVTMHQDSTYLLNEPETINAYWIPLQDVGKDNGCVWVLPGTQTSKLYEKFRVINGVPKYEFDGPIDYKEQHCIPIEMNQGDLLIFNGRVLHKSHDNLSKKSRYAYTWHTMSRSSKWSPQNWVSMENILKYQHQFN